MSRIWIPVTFYIAAILLIVVAVVIAVITFGAAAGLVVGAISLSGALIGMAVATSVGTVPRLSEMSARIPDDAIGAALCYYDGEGYSEGATIKMADGSVRECTAQGTWAHRP